MSVTRVVGTYKGDVNPASGENLKESLLSKISPEASIKDDSSNEDTLNTNNWQ